MNLENHQDQELQQQVETQYLFTVPMVEERAPVERPGRHVLIAATRAELTVTRRTPQEIVAQKRARLELKIVEVKQVSIEMETPACAVVAPQAGNNNLQEEQNASRNLKTRIVRAGEHPESNSL